MESYVYILTNLNKTVLYIGATQNLSIRLMEHFNLSDRASRFAAKYKCKYLVYYEKFPDLNGAFKREKQLKNWHRDWKNNLIEQMNPQWEDLSPKFLDSEIISGSNSHKL